MLRFSPLVSHVTRSIILIASFITSSQLHAADPPPPEIPPAKQILATLHKEHPRLLATKKDFDELRKRVIEIPQLKKWHDALIPAAEKTLTAPKLAAKGNDLGTARTTVNRIYELSMAYRFTADKRFAERAFVEMEVVAKFPDWHPAHFLDVAEMTHAAAIAYDWCYDAWTDEQRKTIRDAIINHGLKPAQELYHKPPGQRWWVENKNNWNDVCNGGATVGAIAVADEAPEIAGDILHEALLSILNGFIPYEPDGGCKEGPGYWNYGTSHAVLMIAAIECALGTDFGYSKRGGLPETGFYALYETNNANNVFSYGDSSGYAVTTPQLYWLARKFNSPALAWYQSHIAKGHALDILWYDPRGEKFQPNTLPLERCFHGPEVVTFRSDWTNPKGLFLGFKGGDVSAAHTHLDMGSFILDSDDVRWAIDLGADSYNLAGYWDTKKQRWSYYRMRAEGHNTLVINPNANADQIPTAVAKIIKFESKPQRAFAIADLTPAYANDASRVWRGMAMLDREQILLQDEIHADKPAHVMWFMHTGATINFSEDKKTATLSQSNAKLQARILEPADATFGIMDAKAMPTSPNPFIQTPNLLVKKLAISLVNVKDARLVVLFTPLREAAKQPPPKAIKPLSDW